MSRRSSRKLSESGEDLCPVCSEIITIFAIGSCDHVVCYRCSTRMRALCKQMYCSICRTDLPKVFFSHKVKRFASYDMRTVFTNQKHQICFEDEICEKAYKVLLEHKCTQCSIDPFPTFKQLKRHAQREHSMQFCDICVDNLKIFTHERKRYTRPDLARHRRLGDPDDTSYKGHPLCEFCENRFLDSDELLRHLRKEHYYCHICDSDSHQYYSDYAVLREHFGDKHYVCEEDDCGQVQFTNVFRCEIDLKAHRAQMHSKSGKRIYTKQDRTLDIQFELKPRPRRQFRDSHGGFNNDDYEDIRERERGSGRRHGDSRNRPDKREEEDMRQAVIGSQAEPDLRNREEFPNISGSVSGAVAAGGVVNNDNTMARRVSEAAGHSVGERSGPSHDADYPLLASDRGPPPPPPPETTVPRPPQPTKPKRAKPAINKLWQFATIEEDFPALPPAPAQIKPNTLSSSSRPLTVKSMSRSEPNLDWRETERQNETKREEKKSEKFSKSKSSYNPKDDPNAGDRPSLSSIGDMIMYQPQAKVVLVSEKPQAPSIVRPQQAPSVNDNDFPSLCGAATRRVDQPRQHEQQQQRSATTAPPPTVVTATVRSSAAPAGAEVTECNGAADTVIPVTFSKPGQRKQHPKTAPAPDLSSDFPSLGGGSGSSSVPATWVPRAGDSRGRGKRLAPRAPSDHNPGAIVSKTTKSIKSGGSTLVQIEPTNLTSNHCEPITKPSKNQEMDEEGFVVVKSSSKSKTEPKNKSTQNANQESNRKKKKKKKGDKVNEEVEEAATINHDVEAFLKASPIGVVVGAASVSEANTVLKDISPSEVNGGTVATKPKRKKPKNKSTKENTTPSASEQMSNTLNALTNGSEPKDVAKTIKTEPLPVMQTDVVPLAKQIHDAQNVKTSELQNLVVFTSDDFPALGGTSKTYLAEPASSLPKAPPGFDRPPGFGVKPACVLTLSDIVATSAPPPGFAEKESTILYGDYSTPDRSVERNQELIENIRSLLRSTENNYNRFSELSGYFLTGVLAGAEYYLQCRELLGEVGFDRIFPELLILLPDIRKQNELYAAFLQEFARRRLNSASVAGEAPALRGCPTCRQIVLESEFALHNRQHDLSDAPSSSPQS